MQAWDSLLSGIGVEICKYLSGYGRGVYDGVRLVVSEETHALISGPFAQATLANLPIIYIPRRIFEMPPVFVVDAEETFRSKIAVAELCKEAYRYRFLDQISTRTIK